MYALEEKWYHSEERSSKLRKINIYNGTDPKQVLLNKYSSLMVADSLALF